MKKLVVTLLMIVLSFTVFSIEIETVKDIYVSLIKTYDEEKGEVIEGKEFELFFNELYNLGLYRFYRTQMIGSAEYVDRPTNVQTYLSQIYTNTEHVFDSIEEKLAFIGFLAYVQSDLSGDAITQETIRSLPAYFTTVQNYKRELENDALTYFGNVIIYSLGIVDESPYTDITRFESNTKIDDLSFYTFFGEPDETINKIISENKESLEAGIKKLIDSKLSGRQLQIAIDNLSYSYITPLLKETDNQINQATQIFLEYGKRKTHIEFIRFIVYGVIILLSLFLFKKYLWISVLGIYLFEFIYILLFYNPIKDVVSSFAYGSFIITFVFIFLFIMVFRSFGKKIKFVEKACNIAIFILTLLIFFTPLYYSKDLLMEENQDFHNSIFEKQLLNDVASYSHSPLYRSTEELVSLLGGEYTKINTFYRTSLGDFLKGLINSNILTQIQADKQSVKVQTYKEGLKINNQNNYINIPSNFSKEITNLVNFSKMQHKRINKELKHLEDTTQNIIKYSDIVFEESVKKTVTASLKKTDLTDPLMNQISTFYDVDKVDKIKLKSTNTTFGTKIITMFFLAISMFVIFNKNIMKYISVVLMYISSFISLFKPGTLEVLSQSGYPNLLSQNYSINYIFSFIMLIISTLMLISFLISKKRTLQSNSN